MTENSAEQPLTDAQPLSRRQFLGVGAAAAVAGTVAVHSGSLKRMINTPVLRPNATKSGTITFWDMEWGPSAYSVEGAALVKQYNATYPNNLPVSYQAITWANQYEKFVSAIASKTAPACSSGSGYQAFQFSKAGAIQPLDDLLPMLEKDGTAADFYPGLLEVLRYQGHQVAIPWQIDIRVLYYRKSVLAQVGGTVPTTWDEFLAVGKALKTKGIYLLNTTGNPAISGWQNFMPFFLGNGGGFFNAKGEPDALQDANLETVEFLLQLSKDGYFDPESVDFTANEFLAAFGSGKVAFDVGNPKYRANFSPSVAADLVCMSPLKSPTGKTGTIYWVNNLMAYKGSYDIQGMYDWYTAYESLMKAYWEKGLVVALPVRKSFGSLPQVANDPEMSIPLKEWLPVAKTTAANGTSLSPGLNALEGSLALETWTQQIIRGGESAKTILSTLQQGVEQIMATA
jgi:multiple sugar transport system substrate-binding protein